MPDSLKSKFRAYVARRLERSGLRDPAYRFQSAIIATRFWLLVLAGVAVLAGYWSNTTLWAVLIFAATLGIATMFWVSFNRKWYPPKVNQALLVRTPLPQQNLCSIGGRSVTATRHRSPTMTHRVRA